MFQLGRHKTADLVRLFHVSCLLLRLQKCLKQALKNGGKVSHDLFDLAVWLRELF